MSLQDKILECIKNSEYLSAYNIWKSNKYCIDEKIAFNICLKLGKVISYRIYDRLGNNLFIYFATKIIAYNNDLHYFPYHLIQGNNCKENVIGSFKFMTNVIEPIILDRVKLDIHPDLCHIVNEWCQTDLVLTHPLTRSLFNEHNNDIIEYTGGVKNSIDSGDVIINQKDIRICDIYKEITSHKFDFHQNDLVLHLRLSDFNYGQIIQYEWIKKLLDTLKWNQLYIICEKPKLEYENNYLAKFVKYNPIFIHGSLYEDVSKIFNAPRIICSNSTLCWIFTGLGSNYISWVPINKSIIPTPSIYTHHQLRDFIWHNYMLHQNVRRVSLNSVEYEIKYQDKIYE